MNVLFNAWQASREIGGSPASIADRVRSGAIVPKFRTATGKPLFTVDELPMIRAELEKRPSANRREIIA